MSPARYVRPIFFSCERHHKLTYANRADARRACRQHHDSGLREYPCTLFRGCWHIGHIPPMVKRGELTMAEWFDLPQRERARRWRREAQA